MDYDWLESSAILMKDIFYCLVGGVRDDGRTLGLILEQFLKFLLKCFLRASEKQRKKKTSAKFMNA